MADDLTAADVRDRLRAACKAAGSQAAWATANDVTAAYVNDVLLGRREPGAAILRGLGLVRVTVYRDAGTGLGRAKEGETDARRS